METSLPRECREFTRIHKRLTHPNHDGSDLYGFFQGMSSEFAWFPNSLYFAPGNWSAANGGLRDGRLRKSEDIWGKRPFSWFPWCCSRPPEKGEKGRKRAKKADFGRFPGRAARHPLNPHLLHPHLRQPKVKKSLWICFVRGTRLKGVARRVCNRLQWGDHLCWLKKETVLKGISMLYIRPI